MLLLDEPTASLDIESARFLRESLTDLAGRGSLLVLATHSGAEIERICTRVAFLSGGSLEEAGAPYRFRDSFLPPWKYRLRFHGPGEPLRDRLGRIPNAACLWSAPGEQHWWMEEGAGAALEEVLVSASREAGGPRIEIDRPLLTFEDAYLVYRMRRGASRVDPGRDEEGG